MNRTIHAMIDATDIQPGDMLVLGMNHRYVHSVERETNYVMIKTGHVEGDNVRAMLRYPNRERVELVNDGPVCVVCDRG